MGGAPSRRDVNDVTDVELRNDSEARGGSPPTKMPFHP